MDESVLNETSHMFYSSYVKDMHEAQARIISIAKLALKEKDNKHMSNYTTTRTTFKVGTCVLAEHRHNSLRRGPKSKLLPFLVGPLLVKEKGEKGMYVLQDLVTLRTRDYHVKDLREFVLDPDGKSPLAVAVSDSLDEFVAEKCLAMKERLSPKYSLRYAGQGTAKPTTHGNHGLIAETLQQYVIM